GQRDKRAEGVAEDGVARKAKRGGELGYILCEASESKAAGVYTLRAALAALVHIDEEEGVGQLIHPGMHLGVVEAGATVEDDERVLLGRANWQVEDAGAINGDVHPSCPPRCRFCLPEVAGRQPHARHVTAASQALAGPGPPAGARDAPSALPFLPVFASISS